MSSPKKLAVMLVQAKKRLVSPSFPVAPWAVITPLLRKMCIMLSSASASHAGFRMGRCRVAVLFCILPRTDPVFAAAVRTTLSR